MIVDDEPRMRKGLLAMMPWTELGYEVVDTATNGKEALEKMNDVNPDVMLIDIKMPIMSGLELIERIRKEKSLIKIIIVSGFGEFEYAKKAMSFNVSGYLLKPIDEEELRAYLVDIKKRLDEESKLIQVKDRLNKELQEQMIVAAIQNDLDKLKIAYDTYFTMTNYSILLIEPNIEAHAIYQAIQYELEYTDNVYAFVYQHYIGIVINTRNRKALLFHQIKRLLDKVFVSPTEYNVALGGNVERFDQLHLSFDSAKRTLDQAFFLCNEEILTEETNFYITQDILTKEMQLDWNDKAIINRLIIAIELGDQQAIANVYERTLALLICRGNSPLEIKQYTIQLFSEVYHHFNKIADQSSTEYLEIPVKIEKQHNIEQLFEFVVNALNKIMTCLDIDNKEHIAKKMVAIIERNYYQSIKMEQIAEVLNYSSAYLGQIFRDYTGEYFNVYLDKIRIQHAKQLLEKGMKIYQVAEKVGFGNADYFHIKFKKYENMSPSTYRNKKKNT